MMLTTPGSGSISSVSRTKTYYTARKQGTAYPAAAGHKYDSFSAPARSFQMDLVSRMAQDVRTATTTGDIQELRRSVSDGEYHPDPMAIAGRMLLLVEE